MYLLSCILHTEDYMKRRYNHLEVSFKYKPYHKAKEQIFLKEKSNLMLEILRSSSQAGKKRETGEIESK